MKPFSQILAEVERDGDVLTLADPVDWKQGRTVYGGLTAALSLHAARELTGETRALRSAMVNFVGPCMEDIRISADMLRSGRNAAAVRTSLMSGETHATECVFTFADMRDSVLSWPARSAPPTEPPGDDYEPRPRKPGQGPSFGQNFDYVRGWGQAPLSGADAPEMGMWLRHKSPDSWEGVLNLICLGDALAPAVLPMLKEPAPLSSMTWRVDMLTDNPTTENGWWLLEARADHAAGGFSSQDMNIWNTRGECVARGSQMMVVFA